MEYLIKRDARLSPLEWDWLKSEGDRNNRSINDQIRLLVKKSMEVRR